VFLASRDRDPVQESLPTDTLGCAFARARAERMVSALLKSTANLSMAPVSDS